VAYTSEIEKLERRWLENPKGRNFAPLADAYRKAGEVDKAIDLCKNGLELHPDYVSAHIVYGRCLIDKKDDPGAEDVFRKVLGLDPENVLALKVLADIASRNSRFDQEVEWLGRLLAADPMNGDAAEMLARAKVKAANVKTAAPPPSPIGLEPTALAEAPTTRMDKPDFVLERASQPAMPGLQVGTPLPAGELETFDGTLDINPAANEAAKADGIELQEDVQLSVDAAPLDGLARTQYEGSGMFKLESAGEGTTSNPEPAAAAAPEVEEDLPSVDLPLIMPDDIPPVEVPAPPAAAPPPPPAPAPPPPSPPPAPTTRRDSGRSAKPAAVALSDDDGAADTAALSQAEPVVTETMADLLLRQGHREEALRVYQALLAQRPNDGRLQARVRELTRGAVRSAGQSAGAFLKNVLGGKGGGLPPAPPAPPAPPPPAPSSEEPPAAVLESATATLEEAFGEESGQDGPTPGSPTRPADDSISLDSVFGDARDSMQQVGPEEEPVPTPPAPPVAGGGGGFSFDDFFNAPPPAAPGAAPAAPGGGGQPDRAPARASGRQSRPVEQDGDLDQFQAWLKGLKS